MDMDDIPNENDQDKIANRLGETVEFIKDVRGKWRWKVKSSNGEIVGSSSQGFATKQKAQENAELLGDQLIGGKVSYYHFDTQHTEIKFDALQEHYMALEAKYKLSKVFVVIISCLGILSVLAAVIAAF